MSTQWLPLFARLLRLLLVDFYQVEVEVPVSDLPRKGDLFLLRRTGSAEPPFTGLWVHLTEWNVRARTRSGRGAQGRRGEEKYRQAVSGFRRGCAVSC